VSGARPVAINVLRSALACVCALALLATAIAPAAAQATAGAPWNIDRKPDPITGAGANAWVLATRVTPRAGHLPRPAGLQLACFKNEPIVRVKFGVMVGANRSASFRYRFDDKPGREPKVRFLADRSTIVLEEKAEVSRFASDLAGSDQLVVSVDSLIFGKTNAAFPVRGAPPAIAAAYAQCPLPSPKGKGGASR
jgi:hypothetical protein